MRLKKHGDTIIEVMMAVAIFAVLAIITINLMNSGINNAQRTLEYTMARNEIDGQAEAIRYIHQSYVAERQLDKDSSQFRQLWDALRAIAQKANDLEDNEHNIAEAKFDINHLSSCSEAYRNNGVVGAYKAFALNTRLILPDSNTSYGEDSYTTMIPEIIVGVDELDEDHITNSVLRPAIVYPRIVYKKSRLSDDDDLLKRQIQGDTQGADNSETSLAEKNIYNLIDHAEGIFVIVAGDNNQHPMRSNYFDFYIRTCWHSVGAIAPSTITTIIRLYNPEVIE